MGAILQLRRTPLAPATVHLAPLAGEVASHRRGDAGGGSHAHRCWSCPHPNLPPQACRSAPHAWQASRFKLAGGVTWGLRKRWCCRTGLNCRPLPYQGSALPLSYGSKGTRGYGPEGRDQARAVLATRSLHAQARLARFSGKDVGTPGRNGRKALRIGSESPARAASLALCRPGRAGTIGTGSNSPSGQATPRAAEPTVCVAIAPWLSRPAASIVLMVSGDRGRG